jgi:hypothetical protein
MEEGLCGSILLIINMGSCEKKRLNVDDVEEQGRGLFHASIP